MRAEGALIGAEIVHEGRESYAVPIHRAVLRDSRLSWGAKGLFCYLWDLPKGWQLRSSHLAEIGPDGIDAVRSRLRELESVRAIRQEQIRIEGGRLAGKRWVIRSPTCWAVEAPLTPVKSTSSADCTEGGVSQPSEKPTLGKSHAKVHQSEGSPIERTTTSTHRSPGGGGFDAEQVQAFVAAGLFVAARGGTPVRNPQKLEAKIRQRLITTGPSPMDLADLAAWEEHLANEAQRVIQEANQVDREVVRMSREAEIVARRQKALEAFSQGGPKEREELLQITLAEAIGVLRKNLEAERANFLQDGNIGRLKPLARMALARNAEMLLRPKSAPGGP